MISRPYLAYHTGSPEAIHSPVHGGIAAYAKIPSFSGVFTGTLSGVVIDRSTKKKLLLSNQHVFFPYQSKSPNVKPGLLVYNPAEPNKAIGKTLITKAESNPWPAEKKAEAIATVGTYHDSALATPLIPVSMEVNNIGVQRSMVEPQKDMRIKFFGRTSRLQRGVIYNPSKDMVSDAGGGKISVRKGVIIADIAWKPGDSGSMVFTEDNHVIGLLYGGDTQSGGRAHICRASAIERAYNVAFSEEEIVGGIEPEPAPTPAPIPSFELPKFDFKLPQIKIELGQKEKVIIGVAMGLGIIAVIGLGISAISSPQK